ncbi:MAG: two pore domain potassium channel family protein [Candidatus Melainabacteria bacterium]|nr:two pore domain potassium channel family protein [Candidatus Melainabacteria bacterium]
MTNDLDKVLTWSDFLYFSFATMTSTGYGDLRPVTSQARSFASLEALVGRFYMAVVLPDWSVFINLHHRQ